ncbi:hypothetical protein [Methylobacterium sp. J-090]|uniref:hypothetical protein n=1 Tax=Methylobacterium sp. J-090 TaxID=2836666 RepID=UPI001FBBA3A8|nr:hypothetical protein [Methylobacterium sp. J-090]MCJ2079865.1 hypothetical protein [Methylobacterium sp. J-090]
MTAAIVSFADALKARGLHETPTPRTRLLYVNRRIMMLENRAIALVDTHKAMLMTGIDPTYLERALWETMDALTHLRQEQWELSKEA